MKDISITLLKVIVIVFIIGISVFFSMETYTGKISIFSWNNDVMSKNDREWLLKYMNKYDINVLFQSFEESSDFRKLTKTLYNNDLETYAVIGSPDMAIDQSGQTLIQEINRVVNFNNKSNDNEKISGIVVDAEPYISDKWDSLSDSEKRTIMTSYSSNLKKAHEITSNNNIKLVPCIPHFFESFDIDSTKEIILNCSDEIAVMNYDKTDEFEQIKNELMWAKEKNIPIWCIYEFQQSGKHELKDINTYYKEGINGARASFKKLLIKSDYNKLYLSIHEYSSLKFR